MGRSFEVAPRPKILALKSVFLSLIEIFFAILSFRTTAILDYKDVEKTQKNEFCFGNVTWFTRRQLCSELAIFSYQCENV